MSTSIRLNCNSLWGHSSCASFLITDGLTVEEARQIGGAHGWRHTAGRDYCPGCSGSRIRPRVIIAVPDTAPRTQHRADERLQLAHDIVTAAVSGSSGGTWCARRTPPDLPDGVPGVEYVTGGLTGTDCIARTGPAGNAFAAGDSTYIALMDPEVGRAVIGVLREAHDSVAEERGLVQDSMTQAAVDLAEALLRPRDERFSR